MTEHIRVDNQVIQQMANASEIMGRYIEYAKQIGCSVDGDSIACTAHQAEALLRWWERNAK